MKKFIRATALVCLVLAACVFSLIAVVDDIVADEYTVIESGILTIDHITGVSVDADVQVAASSGSYEANVNFLGIIPIKTVTVDVTPEITVVPAGIPFGIKMFTEGILVVGISDVVTDDGSRFPASDAGIKMGDVILSIDETVINTNEEIYEIISSSGGEPLDVTIRRQNTQFSVALKPVADVNGVYRAGLWVRDSSAGIGTMTFYDPVTLSFGGLGHAICDVDTGEILPLLSGEVVDVKITGVIKGTAGSAGELKGVFAGGANRGYLLTNTETGIFGVLYNPLENTESVTIGVKQDIVSGPAKIITTLDESGPKEYDINIINVDVASNSTTKNMVIEITDPALLEKTGGIVQGMSGSPIVQDGKLVGAVTHVFLNDPTKGYGIFAENMIDSLIEYSESGDLAA